MTANELSTVISPGSNSPQQLRQAGPVLIAEWSQGRGQELLVTHNRVFEPLRPKRSRLH